MLSQEIEKHIQGATGKVAIVLKDLQKDQWIYELGGDDQIPSASIIKILIMVEAMKQVNEGRYDLNQKVIIEPNDKVPYSILSDLKTQEFTLLDVITLMIIVSDNTATNVLIDLLGFDRINKLARELGLEKTVLERKMMDEEAVKRGQQNKTSPRNMVHLLETIYRKKILNPELCELMLDIMKKQKDLEMLKRYLPEDLSIAHKTGDLLNLNHDIGIFYLPTHTFLLGVFVTEAVSNLTAKQLIGKVSKCVYDYFQTKETF
ncbi:beta-lactamase class A [Anaerosolibacter carboniphilus]|uniref:Beta-lactamase class A n=1 Tax=Anaerosolibacter carboniphilus TaxID=1417629 RepID=A0A841KXP6_9FIRM|nr:serine hydrolase [Anaerosolibacter carboniphilus]MBB6215702.1 beta-lactamase class A [Anaerosolibacter carboniphilus]